MLEEYKWPGNVRELKNMIEKMVILSDENTISMAQVWEHESKFIKNQTSPDEIDLKDTLEQMELKYIHDYYEAYGTLEKAAEKLHMNMKTLSRRKRYLEEKKNENSQK